MPKPTSKRINWTRDELILALDLYQRIDPKHISDKSPEVVALSKTLNSLPIHPQTERSEKFRNEAGVSMKLFNFMWLDERYPDEGLKQGGKLDKVIWDEFAGNSKRLRDTAEAIIVGASVIPPPSDPEELSIDEEEEFPEGRLLTQLHKRRERNPLASKKKKKLVLKSTGTLACEVCGFDFADRYKTLGQGFAECHHRKPLSGLTQGKTIRLKDLAIVCANCHRMLHRARPWKTVEELKTVLIKQP
jgi:5-methylcytosine-specific restriction protein A